MKGMYRYLAVSALFTALLLPVLATAATSNIAVSGIVKFYSDKASYYPNSDIKLVVEFSAPFNGTVLIRVTNAEGKVVALASANLREATKYVYVYKHNETTDGIGTFTAELTYSGQALIAGEWQTVYSAKPLKITFTVAPSYSIKGYVVDENGNPVAGACVCVKETGAKTVTGQDGSFTIAVSMPGRYTIMVEKVDYMPNMTTVEVVHTGITEIKKPIEIVSQAELIKKLLRNQKTLSDTVDKLVNAVSALTNKYNALVQSVNKISSKLDKVARMVNEQNASIKELMAAIGQLQGQLKAVANQVTDLTEQIKYINTELETNYATKDYVSMQLTEVKAGIEKLNGQLMLLQEKLAQLEEKTNKIAAELENKYASKDYVKSQLSSAKKEILDQVSKQLTDLKQQISSLQDKLTNLQNSVIQQLSQQMQKALSSADSAGKWALAAVVVAIIGIIVAIYVAIRMMKLTAA